MKVYILRKSDNKIVSTYDNVEEINENYITLNQNTTKIYCGSDEYISLTPTVAFNIEKLQELLNKNKITQEEYNSIIKGN